MASIKRRADRGGKWWARYRDPDGRQRSKMFDRKVDAERWLDSVRGEISRGAYVDPTAGKQTFGAYAKEWQASQVHRDGTVAQVDAHMRNHILPFFEDRPLASVRASEVQAWVKGRSAVLAPSTVDVVYRWVSSIFRSAVTDRLITHSPCVNIRLPKVPPTLVTPLPLDSVDALIDAAPDRYKALLVAAAGTGLRQGELFGLTVEHLDMLRRTLRVEQQLQYPPGGGPPALVPPKTLASYRTLPVPDVVLDALAAHLAEFPATNDLGLVFTNAKGLPIRRSGFHEGCWAPSIATAGLAKGTHFHELRHFYASLLIRHGESVKVVQVRLGHASARETLDTYSHLWPDSEDRTRAAVDAVLGSHLVHKTSERGK